MHKLGCPARNSPYATCECAASDMREHTHALEEFNRNAAIIGSRIEEMEAENSALHVQVAELTRHRDSLLQSVAAANAETHLRNRARALHMLSRSEKAARNLRKRGSLVYVWLVPVEREYVMHPLHRRWMKCLRKADAAASKWRRIANEELQKAMQ